jgi:hypothetical protein
MSGVSASARRARGPGACGTWFRALLALGSFALATPAQAHPLFTERYLICHLESDGPTVQSALRSVLDLGSDFTPLPSRSDGPRLPSAPLVIADLVQPAPIGQGKKAAPVSPPTELTLAEDSLDYRCIGLPRGKPGMLRVLGGSLTKRYRGEPHGLTTIIRHAGAAGTFQVTEAIPAMAQKLARAIPDELEPWQKLERLHMKVALARALADLGDRASAPLVRDFLREREPRDFPGFWTDTLDALQRLDPKMAHDYAREALGRVLSAKELGTPETNRLRALLPLLASPSAGSRDEATVALLRKIADRIDPKGEGAGHEACLIMAARVRMGDDDLRRSLAPELATDLRTQRAVSCYSEVIVEVFPGDSPDELDTLFHRQRTRALVRLVGRLTRDPSPAGEPARQKIRGYLKRRSQDPDISDRGDRRFDVEDHALHLAMSAKLGDRGASARLTALVADEKDHTVGPWVAVITALDLDLEGAEDLAVQRLLLGRTEHTERHSRESWPTRGDRTITEHGAVVERLAARGNDAFVLGLLDRQEFTRHVAVFHLSRLKPQAACERVARAASGAEHKAVLDAFWALTVLGDTCRPTFARLLDDPKTSDALRGAALEGRAMLRAPIDLTDLSALRAVLAKPAPGQGAAWERARDVLRSRE